MKSYRYVYDKVTVNGIEYTHTIPRFETYDKTFEDNLISAKQAIINFSKLLSKR